MDSLHSESAWKTPETASDGSRNESWTRDNFDLVFDVFIRENESFQTAVLEYLRKRVPKRPHPRVSFLHRNEGPNLYNDPPYTQSIARDGLREGRPTHFRRLQNRW